MGHKLHSYTIAYKLTYTRQLIKSSFSTSSSAVSQNYITETNNAHVIFGNSALLKCEIPSFVADFISVESWVDSDSNHYYKSGQEYGKWIVHNDLWLFDVDLRVPIVWLDLIIFCNIFTLQLSLKTTSQKLTTPRWLWETPRSSNVTFRVLLPILYLWKAG